MIPELGHFALLLAFCLSGTIAWYGLAGAHIGRRSWMLGTINMVFAQTLLVAAAFAALAWGFVTDDFSIAYVANNSNSLLPAPYKLSAIWGAHEGSFLLWVLIMCLWMSAVALRCHALPLGMHARVLGVLGLLNLGFLAFLLFTSNPFDRLIPLTPLDGSDLNPLLQDFGLIVHPPVLYAGYVGFSVAFAFAVAALIGGNVDSAWARWSRTWTNVAWAFLTVGIALGSWWAYYELGWGGWWFWDPVENASFMPWLAGTALIHSLAATEKRGTFKNWTLLLALLAFSLSLIGAFIVRSGVLTSVHAFAVDPLRGMFILAFLGVVVGGSLTLYAIRASAIDSPVRYTIVSRETALLVNNLLLVVAMAMVLLGTLYPLAYEALSGGDKISIGPPWFNRFFVPLMLGLGAFLGLAPLLNWKRTGLATLLGSIKWMFPTALALGLGLPLLLRGELSSGVVIAVFGGVWIIGGHLLDLPKRLKPGIARVPLAYWGMWCAHVGFAVTLMGVALTHDLSAEKDLRMVPGQSVTLEGVVFTFERTRQVAGPNYIADEGRFEVLEGNRRYALNPQKRIYRASGSRMTEAAIDAGFLRDIYVSLGEPLEDGAWAVRVHVKPFVRWIWFGALLMGF
ncbi:MAG: heme lyase CcmF/NrfE family subunit, partial [Proteobacteria bacterium]|nr:heme lyase CcmF/NrfE family subunit [Pseudomonadota bacterium]